MADFSQLEAWQQRVLEERDQLADRVLKLGGFIAKAPEYVALPDDERVRMLLQFEHMQAYLRVLERRIDAWGE